MADSKALLDSRRILKLVRQKAYAATLATLDNAAAAVLIHLNEYRKYKHVTGNTWTSTTVGVFYKGKLVSLWSMGEQDEEPTRRTLRKGETYNLTYYYKGSPAGDSHGKAGNYRGEYGEGGQWGPTLGPWYMRRQHNAKRKTWNLVVAIPVSYAGYNPRIVETMQNIMDDLPNVIDYSIVRVEDAPSQTDAFKDVPF